MKKRVSRCKVCGAKISHEYDEWYFGNAPVHIMDLEGNSKYWLCSKHATLGTNNDRKAAMWMEQDWVEEAKECLKCGELFYQNSRNQKYCEECKGESRADYRKDYYGDSKTGTRTKGKKRIG